MVKQIYSSINLSVNIDNSVNPGNNTVIRTEIVKDEFTNVIQIANNVTQAIEGKSHVGSIIDIDTYRNYTDSLFINDYKREVVLAHSSEKELFFSLLKEDFLNSLKPIYHVVE